MIYIWEGSSTARIPLVDGQAQTYELFHYSLPAEVQVYIYIYIYMYILVQ
jgi:hypothetical protein